MKDIDHVFGADLSLSPARDLALASSDAHTRQRVLRRLLTNPGDYRWQPDYGAGLAQYIGRTADSAGVVAVFRAQLLLELAVAQTPAPQVSVTPLHDGLAVSIAFNSADTGVPQSLVFSVV